MYTEDTDFISINFAEDPLKLGEYEDCRFIKCSFSNADLSHCNFENCTFQDCDLSLCRLVQTSFRDTDFKGCKMLGMHFENCKDFRFSIGLNNCNINHSSFYRKQMKGIRIVDCSMIDVDFSEADLSKTIFDNCNLSGAKFENTILIESDLRGALNFSINPSSNKLSKTKFSKEGIVGLLDHLSIVID